MNWKFVFAALSPLASVVVMDENDKNLKKFSSSLSLKFSSEFILLSDFSWIDSNKTLIKLINLKTLSSFSSFTSSSF